VADLIGQQLGNYRLVRLLGRGGYAEVYLGQHVRLNIQAAIKVQHLRLENQEITNFQEEAQTIASLLHPHIVRVLDFDVQDGLPFLVMDYAPNGSLRYRHPRGTPLPLPLVVSYVTQVAAALQYAHDQRLIHRDVKPDNMLLGRRNEVMLSDFGIATIAHHTSTQSTQVMAGTIPYMAPEQIQGRPRPASDQYALGIVIYEWLTGERPFQGSFTEIASQHILAPPPPLSEKVPTLLPEVEQVVLRALEKDPRRRFGSVRAFATALEQACQTALSRPIVVPSQETLPREPSRPSDEKRMASEPGQASLPTPVVTPRPVLHSPDHSLGDIADVPLFPNPAYISGDEARNAMSAPPLSLTVEHPAKPKVEDRSPRRIISRRNVLIGMAGLVAVSGGITWLSLSRKGNGSHLNSGITPSSSSQAPTCSQAFSDDFTSSYDKRWQWMPEGNATIQVINGALAITTPAGHDLYVGNTSAPKLLQPLPEKMMVETSLKFAPMHTYQGAGLLIWQDGKNFIRLERGYGDVGAIIFEQEINGVHQKITSPFSGDAKQITTTTDRVMLRLQRDGNRVNAWWQDAAAKTSWQVVGSTTSTFSVNAQIGLAVVNEPQGPGADPARAAVTAYFDYVHVTC